MHAFNRPLHKETRVEQERAFVGSRSCTTAVDKEAREEEEEGAADETIPG